jgi:hypothetical protein
MAPVRVCNPLKARLRLPLFLLKKWFRLALPTRTLPFLLMRTRCLVPLWVFNLGTGGNSFLIEYDWFFAAMADYEAQLPPGQLRLLFNYYYITKVGDDLLGDVEADLFVGLLTAPVKQHYFDLVSGFQKFAGPVELDFQIVGADFQPHSDLFHIQRLGRLAILLLLFSALVVKLAPVNDFGDRRIGVGRNLYQIQLFFLR